VYLLLLSQSLKLTELSKRLKASKSIDLDGISSFMIKRCSRKVGVISETFPSSWKETAVVCISTTGSSNMICNYRPVSILNHFYKISEYVVIVPLCHF
jgi:hypothetical protein